MRIFFKTVSLIVLLAAHPSYAEKGSPRRSKLKVKHFTKLTKLEFFVKTNVPGFNFQGHLKNALPIKGGQLVIPHKQLTTEMDLRDRHMYEKIFKNQDITFRGIAKCRKRKTVKCKVVGKLGIAGKEKKQIFIAKKSGKQFKFTHRIRLSDFDIDKPEFKGVAVRNDITLTARIK